MSALDGFYATWNDARNTFGEGTPQGGSQIDASPTFSKLGEDVQAAAPGDTWTGAGSDAYGGANKKHGENLTKLADLDQRLAAQLDQAADVVTTGRGNLDAVRQWVTDAANSVPPGKQRDELLMK
ncbi:EspA/EspE family type VII secretion system effector, partial [Mycolicibacterium arseniciresistens]